MLIHILVAQPIHYASEVSVGPAVLCDDIASLCRLLNGLRPNLSGAVHADTSKPAGSVRPIDQNVSISIFGVVSSKDWHIGSKKLALYVGSRSPN